MQFSADAKNIGELLNAKGFTETIFQVSRRFQTKAISNPAAASPTLPVECGATHNMSTVLGGTGKTGALPFETRADYLVYHELFQYYSSTANLDHLPPSATGKVSFTDKIGRAHV